MAISITIIGDLPPKNRFRIATDVAIEQAAKKLDISARPQWIGTDVFARGDIRRQLSSANAIWIAPGSPYKNMDAALAAIRYARESHVPLLGTCGGFQHIVIEHARNVLGLADAEHAESNPYASVLFISRLECSLVGRSMTIRLAPGSLLERAYGQPITEEGYYCNFGVNPAYVEVLRSGPLRVAASDAEGEIRAVELPGHPFFVGTLFIPQTRSTPENPHPLVTAFLKAAMRAT